MKGVAPGGKPTRQVAQGQGMGEGTPPPVSSVAGKVAPERATAAGAAGAMLPVIPGAVGAAGAAFPAPDEPVIQQVQASLLVSP